MKSTFLFFSIIQNFETFLCSFINAIKIIIIYNQIQDNINFLY